MAISSKKIIQRSIAQLRVGTTGKARFPIPFIMSAPRKWFQYQLEWPSLSINSIIESLRKKESMFVFNSSSSKGIGRNRSLTLAHIRTGSFPCLIGACRQLDLLRKLSLIRSRGINLSFLLAFSFFSIRILLLHLHSIRGISQYSERPVSEKLSINSK